MYLYTYICIHIYLHIYIYNNRYIYTVIHISVYIYIHMHIYIDVYTLIPFICYVIKHYIIVYYIILYYVILYYVILYHTQIQNCSGCDFADGFLSLQRWRQLGAGDFEAAWSPKPPPPQRRSPGVKSPCWGLQGLSCCRGLLRRRTAVLWRLVIIGRAPMNHGSVRILPL